MSPRTIRKAHRKLSPSELLMRAAESLSSAGSLHEIIEEVKHVARAGTQADGMCFVMREGDECLYIDEDAIEPLWKGRRFPIAGCVSGWAIHHRLAAVIDDVASDPRVSPQAYAGTFVKSLVVAPIRSRSPLGAIGVYWAREHGPDAETAHWLQALADAAGAGIEAVMADREAFELESDRVLTGDQTRRRTETVRMCAWTRRFFHNGEWLSVEGFLRARFGITVTHGISDEAMTALSHELREEFSGLDGPVTG